MNWDGLDYSLQVMMTANKHNSNDDEKHDQFMGTYPFPRKSSWHITLHTALHFDLYFDLYSALYSALHSALHSALFCFALSCSA